MKFPSILFTANVVLACVAVVAAIFALGLFVFVLRARDRVGHVEISSPGRGGEAMTEFLATDGHSAISLAPKIQRHNPQIKQMAPIRMDQAAAMVPMAPIGREKSEEEQKWQRQQFDDGSNEGIEEEMELHTASSSVPPLSPSVEAPFRKIVFSPLCAQKEAANDASTMC